MNMMGNIFQCFLSMVGIVLLIVDTKGTGSRLFWGDNFQKIILRIYHCYHSVTLD